MRFVASIFILTVLLSSCSDPAPAKDTVTIEKVEATILPEDTYDYDTLQGMYMGKFGGSDIRIILNYISQKNAIGYDIHKGLQRNIMGSVTRSGDTVQLILAEPGDNEYDGKFTINFIGNDLSPFGSWESNSGKISKQEFKLKKIVRPEDESYDNVTISNFSRIFDYVSDSIGDYKFNNDGLVILEYYEDKDGYDEYDDNEEEEEENRDLAQMKQLKGSWSLKGDVVTINWEPNTIFPNNILVLNIEKGEYEGQFHLKGEGDHELWGMYGGW